MANESLLNGYTFNNNVISFFFLVPNHDPKSSVGEHPDLKYDSVSY